MNAAAQAGVNSAANDDIVELLNAKEPYEGWRDRRGRNRDDFMRRKKIVAGAPPKSLSSSLSRNLPEFEMPQGLQSLFSKPLEEVLNSDEFGGINLTSEGEQYKVLPHSNLCRGASDVE